MTFAAGTLAVLARGRQLRRGAGGDARPFAAPGPGLAGVDRRWARLDARRRALVEYQATWRRGGRRVRIRRGARRSTTATPLSGLPGLGAGSAVYDRAAFGRSCPPLVPVRARASSRRRRRRRASSAAADALRGSARASSDRAPALTGPAAPRCRSRRSSARSPLARGLPRGVVRAGGHGRLPRARARLLRSATAATRPGLRFFIPALPFLALGLAPAFARWRLCASVLAAASVHRRRRRRPARPGLPPSTRRRSIAGASGGSSSIFPRTAASSRSRWRAGRQKLVGQAARRRAPAGRPRGTWRRRSLSAPRLAPPRRLGEGSASGENAWNRSFVDTTLHFGALVGPADDERARRRGRARLEDDDRRRAASGDGAVEEAVDVGGVEVAIRVDRAAVAERRLDHRVDLLLEWIEPSGPVAVEHDLPVDRLEREHGERAPRSSRRGALGAQRRDGLERRDREDRQQHRQGDHPQRHDRADRQRRRERADDDAEEHEPPPGIGATAERARSRRRRPRGRSRPRTGCRRRGRGAARRSRRGRASPRGSCCRRSGGRAATRTPTGSCRRGSR